MAQPLTPRLIRHCGGTLDLSTPRVMGILNVTPDSFSDGGRFVAHDNAMANVRRMIGDRADVIDVGGESTRPGATPVGEDEEWRRLEPVLADVVAAGTPVSIDTYKSRIARRACAAGAVIVNDVWGLQKDAQMADVVAEAGAGVIMMHNRDAADGSIDILDDIDRFFSRSMEIADRAGIPRDRQMLDPGIGFGKTIDQNYLILNRLERLHKHGLPLLVGASRKRLIGAVLEVDAEERLFGSMALHMAAMMKGAAMIRVHDVRAHADAARIAAAIRREGIA